jgi:hypothetical protein
MKMKKRQKKHDKLYRYLYPNAKIKNENKKISYEED